MLKNIASHLPYFSSVAKNLSFSVAAAELSISQSAISYQIKSLETKLGVKLFIRGKGSKVALSCKGNKLYLEYALLERNFNQVLRDSLLHHDSTVINITAPIDFGVKRLTPLLSSFETDGLRINLDLSDDIVELKKGQFDFSIRNNTDEPELEYLPLVAVKNHLFCSKDYADKHNLYVFKDLTDTHRLIVRNAVKSRSWDSLFERYNKSFQAHENKQVINNSFAIQQALLADAGIGILSDYFIEQLPSKKLHIFADPISSTQLYLAYQPSYIANRWAALIKNKITNNGNVEK